MKIIAIAVVAMLTVAAFALADNTLPGIAAGTPSAATPVSENVVTVTIERFRYEPERVEVPAGTRVRWVNRDGAAHTVTVDGLFDSGRMALSATYARVFDEPGPYFYECVYHQNMTGRIIVLDPQASPVATPTS